MLTGLLETQKMNINELTPFADKSQPTKHPNNNYESVLLFDYVDLNNTQATSLQFLKNTLAPAPAHLNNKCLTLDKDGYNASSKIR